MESGCDAPVLPEEPRTVQVFVKTLTGRTITLNVSPSDTVAHLKSVIHAKQGVEPAAQTLLTGWGVQLSDGGRTLAEYRVGALSTVHMIARMRGD
jgi:hypothetical protein